MPKLLDLFCGAGGASVGYHRAGFEVVGVDINPQPHYPFEFHQADALTFPLGGFDVIHASPPCQAFSSIGKMGRVQRGHRPRLDLVAPIRARLIAAGVPYVIENVQGSPLLSPSRCCGSSFGLRVRRHRLFESNVLLIGSDCLHIAQGQPIGVYGDHPENCRIRTDGAGGSIRRASTAVEGQQAMGVTWLPVAGRLDDTWRPLAQMIPPAYTEFIGKQLLGA